MGTVKMYVRAFVCVIVCLREGRGGGVSCQVILGKKIFRDKIEDNFVEVEGYGFGFPCLQDQAC